MSRRMSAYAITFALLVIVLAVWLADIPIGYYQFRQMCKKDAGLRIHNHIDLRSGWMTQNETVALSVAYLYPEVPLVRFHGRDGSLRDVKYIGGIPGLPESYQFEPADSEKVARYSFENKMVSVPDGIRLYKYLSTLGEIPSGQLVFEYSGYGFSWTEPDRTLFGQGSGTHCLTGREKVDAIRSLIQPKR